MIISAKAPVRIDFAGAWTDVAYFSDVFGGATLNAAVRMYVTGRLEAGAGSAAGLLHALAAAEQEEAFGLPPEPSLQVTYGSALPAGSGLGSSATLNVVWLALARGEPVETVADRLRVAELAYDVEKALGIIGGRQDQYASAVGGLNLFEFGSEGVCHTPVVMSEASLRDLESRLVLVYTGQTRLSSNLHRNVWGSFQAGKEATVRALFSLRASAYEAKSALEAGDLDAFAQIVTAQRGYMADLDASTSNAQIEGLFETVAPEILGGKPCGAGGGGCLFFLARDEEAKSRIKKKLQARELEGLDVAFDFQGLQLEIHS
jgi:D-glycero-alpha-D-manno-heptose-7-phosphate kinase